METVVDAHRAVHDRDAHHLPDETPWHRVGIAIDLDRTIALHTPEEFTTAWNGGIPAIDVRVFASPRRNRSIGASPVVPCTRISGDIPRPCLKVRLKGFPARERAAGDRVPLDVADTVLGGD
jgi:hypothetical protein